MKKILAQLLVAIAVVCALAFTPHASAQSPGVLNITNSATANVAVSATNTFTAFAVSEYDNVGLGLTFNGTGASTSTVRLEVYRSIDSTYYETSPVSTTTVTMNGTTPVTTFVQLPVGTIGGVGTLRLKIANTNASVAVTNLVLNARFNSFRRR